MKRSFPKTAPEFMERAAERGYYFAMYSRDGGFAIWQDDGEGGRAEPQYHTSSGRWVMDLATEFWAEINAIMVARFDAHQAERAQEEQGA